MIAVAPLRQMMLVHPDYDSGWREEDLRVLQDPHVNERMGQSGIELPSFGVSLVGESLSRAHSVVSANVSI
jgi:hypothetical protein